jgi:hypothetical protein
VSRNAALVKSATLDSFTGLATGSQEGIEDETNTRGGLGVAERAIIGRYSRAIVCYPFA